MNKLNKRVTLYTIRIKVCLTFFSYLKSNLHLIQRLIKN